MNNKMQQVHSANWSIRPAQAADLPALASFAANQYSYHFAHLYEPRHLAEHLQATCSAEYFAAQLLRRQSLWLACEAGRIVGYVKWGSLNLPAAAACISAGEIHRLYVHPDLIGQGLGQRLMQLALNALGSAEIYVGVWSENTRAQHFYQRFGFEKVGEYGYAVGPHTDLEYILKRPAGCGFTSI